MPRLPKAIIAKYGISKKAWQVFRGKGRTPRKGKVKTMARRIRRYFPRRTRRRGPMTIPIAVLGGALAPLADPNIIGNIQAGRFDRAAVWTVYNYTGYDLDTGNFNYGRLFQRCIMPMVAGFAVHKVANLIGINRQLARAKVPLIRI